MAILIAAREEKPIDCQLEPSLTEFICHQAEDICRQTTVAPHICQFLSSIILESLLLRKDEWRTRGVEYGQTSMIEIVRLVHPSLRTVLSEASATAIQDGREYLMLVDVVAAIAKKWCRIFPFCRGSNASG